MGKVSPVVHQYDRLIENCALRAWQQARARRHQEAPLQEFLDQQQNRTAAFWSSPDALMETCTSPSCKSRLRLSALEEAVIIGRGRGRVEF